LLDGYKIRAVRLHHLAERNDQLLPEKCPLPRKEMLADRIIREKVLWTTGGALLPVSMIDMIAITAVELKMLKELSTRYEVPFTEDQVKSILVSLLAGLAAPALSRRSPLAIGFEKWLRFFIS
jgi:Domain of unknown function (DUF697)